MTRKCSNCGNNGHNSRTCRNNLRGMDHQSGEGLRLFGVRLQVGTTTNSSPNLKTCFGMETLVAPSRSVSASSCSPSVSSSSSLVSVDDVPERFPNYDYLSDGLVCRTQEKKKGVPWSEEEHRRFLAGLEKLGKGDWRGISRHFIVTRSPTQVASHAQKHFLRQTIMKQKKCRSSLFDLVEAPSHTNQSARIRHEPNSLSNYVNFMSCYNPMSVNVNVPSVSLEKSSPLTPKPQPYTEKTPNLELSIAPSKYT